MDGSDNREEPERASCPPTSDGGQSDHEAAPNRTSGGDHVSCPVRSVDGSSTDAFTAASLAKDAKALDRNTPESGAASVGSGLPNVLVGSAASPPPPSGEQPKSAEIPKPKIRIKLRLGSSPKNVHHSKTDSAVRRTQALGDSTLKPHETDESESNHKRWQVSTLTGCLVYFSALS
jgi:hypothetical protein